MCTRLVTSNSLIESSREPLLANSMTSEFLFSLDTEGEVLLILEHFDDVGVVELLEKGGLVAQVGDQFGVV